METLFLLMRSVVFAVLAGAATALLLLAPLNLLGYHSVFGQAMAVVLGILAAMIAFIWSFPKPRSDLM